MSNSNVNSKSRIITIASGKGGVGKSNISVSLALALKSLSKDVVIFDADIGLANINILFGFVSRYNLSHLVDGSKTVDEVIFTTTSGVKVLSGYSGFNSLKQVSENNQDVFLNSLKALDKSDYILIDAGAGISDTVLSLIFASNDVILITTPEPTSITDTYGMIKTISYRKSNVRIRLLVNRSSSKNEAEEVSNRIIKISKRFLNIQIDYLGFVLDDAVVRNAVLKQKPFYLLNRYSKVSLCIDSITKSIVDNIGYDSSIYPSSFSDMFYNLMSGFKVTRS